MSLAQLRAELVPARPPLGAGLAMFPRNWPLLAYLAIALGLTMSLGQYFQEDGGLLYLALVLPVILLPLARPMLLVDAVRGRALPVVIFGVVAMLWHASRGDFAAVIPMSLLVWGVIWMSSDAARIRFDDFYLLYGGAVLAGIVIWLVGDINQWGVLPGTTTASDESVWRVSFFPNIAYTGFFSLAFLMVSTRDVRPRRRFVAVLLGVAVYFVIFSFVRTAVISLAVYAALAWLFRRKNSPAFMFWTALLSAIAINVLIAYSSSIFSAVQTNPLLSRLFLRGESGLSVDEIYEQLYRPWVWGQHFHQFFTSPYLMGWGSVDFNQLKTYSLFPGMDQNDDISFLTRLLAQYGLAGALFIGFLVSRLAVFAKRGDAWGCACFPVATLAMMHWGTMFHPSDPMFAIFMIVIVQGSEAFGPRPMRAVSKSELIAARPEMLQ